MNTDDMIVILYHGVKLTILYIYPDNHLLKVYNNYHLSDIYHKPWIVLSKSDIVSTKPNMDYPKSGYM